MCENAIKNSKKTRVACGRTKSMYFVQWKHDSSPKVDESTLTPGLFLVGPAVRHDTLSFCFVYKFRQRFGVVADAMARGLGLDTAEAVERCREMNMFLDDFECCADGCGESC